MPGSNSKHWVLLAAGSKGWKDYRDQANVCRAYQIFHKNGIPDEQIVVMMYDDIAYNKENPFPGNIINTLNGPNVYPGVPKDYTGEEVSAKNFLAALRGDSTAGKKVICSDRNNTIFIYLTSHGKQGQISFPDSKLNAEDLIKTVKNMSRKRTFSKMVIYVDACHSGSMVEKLSEERDVYAVSSCKPEELSYSCYHDNERKTFLSDHFSAHWLNHLENKNMRTIKFGEQFSYLKKNVSEAVKKDDKTQTPCNYGDMKDGMYFEARRIAEKTEKLTAEVYVKGPYAGSAVHANGAKAEVGLGRTEAAWRIFSVEANVLNASAEAEANGLEVGAMARAEIGSVAAAAGPVKVKLGLGIDTGFTVGLNKIEYRILGSGITLGRTIGVSFLGSEFKLKLF